MSTATNVKGHGSPGSTFYPVIIIGAGMGGIGMACQLKDKLRFDQFKILERNSSFGGTWWSNKYPGVACDVPAIFYSFSFCQNPNWSSFYPSGDEILRYQHSVVEKYELVDKIQLNSDVTLCRWDNAQEEWEVTVHHLQPGVGDLSAADRKTLHQTKGQDAVYTSVEILRCKVLVTAVGGLVEPRSWPSDIPGHENFQGNIIHSARWNDAIHLADKNVVVIGAGCSAIQIVPKLLSERHVKRVTQIMREPPWMLPRKEPPSGEANWTRRTPWIFSKVPILMDIMRKVIVAHIESSFVFMGSSWINRWAREKTSKELLKYLCDTAPQQHHEILTPRYSLGCKRRIYDVNWFSSLADPRMELTTLALKSVGTDSVLLGPSYKTHTLEAGKPEEVVPCDVIILANGFEVSNWFNPLEIIGTRGESLNSVFKERGGPQMYKGTAIDGFPNMFAMSGPNSITGHSSVILTLENQIGHALPLINAVLRRDATRVELRNEAAISNNKEFQTALRNRVWNNADCSSWYVTKDGHNSVSYPYSLVWQTWSYLYPTWSDWEISWTQQGRRKRTMRLARQVVGLPIVAFFAYFFASNWGYKS